MLSWESFKSLWRLQTCKITKYHRILPTSKAHYYEFLRQNCWTFKGCYLIPWPWKAIFLISILEIYFGSKKDWYSQRAPAWWRRTQIEFFRIWILVETSWTAARLNYHQTIVLDYSSAIALSISSPITTLPLDYPACITPPIQANSSWLLDRYEQILSFDDKMVWW